MKFHHGPVFVDGMVTSIVFVVWIALSSINRLSSGFSSVKRLLIFPIQDVPRITVRTHIRERVRLGEYGWIVENLFFAFLTDIPNISSNWYKYYYYFRTKLMNGNYWNLGECRHILRWSQWNMNNFSFLGPDSVIFISSVPCDTSLLLTNS